MEYLAGWRFQDVEKSDLPLSPRLAAFVDSAWHHEVGCEALTLACMLECGAATFPPNIVDSAAGQDPGCLLLCFSRILQNVEGFLRQVQKIANSTGKQLIDFNIRIRKLKKAEALFWKIVFRHKALASPLTQYRQSQILVDLLS